MEARSKRKGEDVHDGTSSRFCFFFYFSHKREDAAEENGFLLWLHFPNPAIESGGTHTHTHTLTHTDTHTDTHTHSARAISRQLGRSWRLNRRVIRGGHRRPKKK